MTTLPSPLRGSFRRLVPVVFAGVLGVAAVGSAKDDIHCNIDAEPGDRMSKGKDLVIEPGARIENAIAVDANLIVKKGASVKNAVALRGNVTLEEGAKVRESALAFDGRVHAADPRQVKGTTLSLGKGLHVRSDEGNEFNLDLNINGQDLGTEILQAVLKDVKECRVTQVAAKDAGR